MGEAASRSRNLGTRAKRRSTATRVWGCREFPGGGGVAGVAYSEGARYASDRGAAAYALLAALPPRDGEGVGPAACLTLISASNDVIDSSVDAMRAAAADVTALLR